MFFSMLLLWMSWYETDCTSIYYIGRVRSARYLTQPTTSLISTMEHKTLSDRYDEDKLVSIEACLLIDENNHILIDRPGVYHITTAVTMTFIRNDTFSILVYINSKNVDAVKTVTSVQKETITIHLNNIFQCSKSDQLSIIIKMHHGKHTITTQSYIAMHLLTSSTQLPGFSLSLVKDIEKNKKDLSWEEPFPLVWSTTSTPGSFSSTNLFRYNNNQFTIAKSGLYLISGNIIITNEHSEECYHGVKLYKNNLQTVITISQVSSRKKKVFTISFNYIARLKQADRLWLKIQTECLHTVVTKATRFSLMFLNYENGHSLTQSKLKPFLFKKGWVDVNLDSFLETQPKKRLISMTNTNKNNIVIQQSGVLLISINLLIMVPQNSNNLKLALLHSRNTSLETSSKQFRILSNGGVSLSQTFISISTLLFVRKGDILSLMLYFSLSDRYMLLNNSTISFMLLNEDNVLSSRKQQTILSSMHWRQINILNYNSQEAEYWYVYDNCIRVIQTGIYYFTASVQLKEVLQADIQVSLIYDFKISSKRKEVLTLKERAASNDFTANLASTLRLNVDQLIGIYIRSATGLTVTATCSVGIRFIGTPSSVIGFQSNLLINQNILENGFQVVNNFFDSQRVVLSHDFSYNTGNYFSHEKGVFSTPFDGVYIISVNVVVKNINALSQEGFLTLMLSVNGDSTSIFQNKRTVPVHQARGSLPITFFMTGSLCLKKNDVVCLKLLSSAIENGSIEKVSSFSIVFINEFPLTYGLHLIRTDNTVYEEKDYSTIAGWKVIANENPPDELNSLSPVITQNENIMIYKSGHYIITLYIILKQLNINKHVKLFIVNQSLNSVKRYLCPDIYKSYGIGAMTCTMILDCKTNDKLSIRALRTENGEAIRKIFSYKQPYLKYGYLSLLLLPHPLVYQMAVSTLQETDRIDNSLSTLKPWQARFAESVFGDNGFSLNNGIVHTRSDGWYLFTASVSYHHSSCGNVTLAIANEKSLDKLIITSKASNSNEDEITLAGVAYLERSTNVTVLYKSCGTINEERTTFTFCFLSNKNTQKYSFQRTVQIKSHLQSISWRLNDNNNVAPHSVITFPKSGVYIVMLSLVVKPRGDDILATLSLATGARRLARYTNVKHKMLTLILAGVFFIKSTKVTLKVYIDATGGNRVLPESTLAISYVLPVSKSTNIGCMMEINNEATIDLWIKDQWYLLSAFESTFLSNMFYENGKIVIKTSGIYFLSLHLIVLTETSQRVSLGMFINEELIAMTTRTSNITSTLYFVQTLNMVQGSIVTLQLKSASTTNIKVQSFSSFNIILIKQLGKTKDEMTPVITKELYPGSNIELSGNMSAVLECNAVGGGNSKKYVWLKDNKKLEDHSGNVFSLHPTRNGKYQCQVLNDGVGPVSKVTGVTVKETNECLTNQHNCVEPNMTCINTFGSYYCSCINNWEYINGICQDPSVRATEVPKIARPKILSLLILILVPIFSLVCVLLIIATVCLAVRQRQQRRYDVETIAFSNYNDSNDERPLHNASLDSSDILDGYLTLDNTSVSTSRSYNASDVCYDSEDEEDVAGFYEHRWKKLKITTAV